MCIALYIGATCFCQDYSNGFSYVFKFDGVTEPADGKYAIIEIRELLGVRAVRFNNDTDEFNILTHLDWTVEEMTFDFESLGFTLSGELIKIYLE